MNHARLKAAIREAREQAKHTWMGWDKVTRTHQRELVSLPVETLNLLLKAANKELARS